MKILVLSQYFWPENFRVNDIAKNLIDKGHEVEILTALPNYPDGKVYDKFKRNPKKFNKFYKAKIHRVPIFQRQKGIKVQLFLNYLSFNITSIIYSYFFLRKKKYDYIITFGTSPITTHLTSIFLAKFTKSKLILWVLDLWPEVILELKIIKNIILYKLLKKLVNYIYVKTDIILAQSLSFKKELEKRVDKPVLFFPSWPEKINYQEKALFNSLKYEKNKLNIVFAGNIGEAQNFEEIIYVIKKIKKKEIRWIIAGGGRKAQELKTFSEINNLKNIVFIKNQPVSKINKVYNHADVLLLPLKAGKFGSYTIPGKFQTYLKINKPILCHAKGEVYNLVKNNKLGLVSKPGEMKKLKSNIDKFYNLKKSNKINFFIDQKKRKKLLQNYSFTKIQSTIDYIFEEYKIIKKKLVLIPSSSRIPFEKNFTLSALNLAYLAGFSSGEIKITNDTYVWPDGIFAKKIFKFDKVVKKLSGRSLLDKMRIPNTIKKIHIIGNLPSTCRGYCENKFKKPIFHHEVPYTSIDNIYKHIPLNFKKNDLIILTLPTPKQEIVSQYISQNSKYFKIINIGGAINMLSGLEKPVPKIFENYFESLWRLQYDPYRRVKRLLKTSYQYIISNMQGKYNNFESKIYK